MHRHKTLLKSERELQIIDDFVSGPLFGIHTAHMGTLATSRICCGQLFAERVSDRMGQPGAEEKWGEDSLSFQVL